MKTLLIYFSLFFLFFFSSCEAFQELENIEDVSVESSWALPLVNSTVALEDFLQSYQEDASLLVDDEGLLYFEYDQELFSQSGKSLLDQLAASFPTAIPVLLPDMELPAGIPGGVAFDLLDLKAGKLSFGFSSAHDKPLSIDLVFPELQKEGEALRFSTLSLPAWDGAGTKPSYSNASTPMALEGYQMLTPEGKFSIRYTAIDADGTEVLLENFVVNFQDLGFSKAQGYFGQVSLEGGEGELALEFFRDRLNGGAISFATPSVTLVSDNSLGLPSRVQVNRFDVLTTEGVTLSLESDLTGQDLDIPYPALAAMGSAVAGTFRLDHLNSNLPELLSSRPVAIHYDITALANPDADTGIRGFLTDSSNLNLSMEVSLPFHGSLADFSARDTIEIDPGSFDAFDEASFKLVTDNTLPLELTLQGYFVDDNFNVLNTLLEEPLALVKAAEVDDNGLSTGTNTTITELAYNQEKFESIKPATRLILELTFATADAGSRAVKVYNYQDVGIRMGAILTKFK